MSIYVYFYYTRSRSEIHLGDMFLYRNMPKSKKLPGTKTQKYIGPIVADDVTHTHVILHGKDDRKKKKVSLEITRLYHPRPDVNISKDFTGEADLPNSKEQELTDKKKPNEFTIAKKVFIKEDKV